MMPATCVPCAHSPIASRLRSSATSSCEARAEVHDPLQERRVLLDRLRARLKEERGVRRSRVADHAVDVVDEAVAVVVAAVRLLVWVRIELLLEELRRGADVPDADAHFLRAALAREIDGGEAVLAGRPLPFVLGAHLFDRPEERLAAGDDLRHHLPEEQHGARGLERHHLRLRLLDLRRELLGRLVQLEHDGRRAEARPRELAHHLGDRGLLRLRVLARLSPHRLGEERRPRERRVAVLRARAHQAHDPLGAIELARRDRDDGEIEEPLDGLARELGRRLGIGDVRVELRDVEVGLHLADRRGRALGDVLSQTRLVDGLPRIRRRRPGGRSRRQRRPLGIGPGRERSALLDRGRSSARRGEQKQD
jgi:hypothetical protein